MTALRKFGRTVYPMMRPEDNVSVKQALNIGAEEEKVKVIFTNDSLGGVIEAMKVINQGDLVSGMGTERMDTALLRRRFSEKMSGFPMGHSRSQQQCSVLWSYC